MQGRMNVRAGLAFASTALLFGAVLVGCGSKSQSTDAGSATLNLTSLPVAEAWVDGRAEGSTPVVLAVAPGHHEVLLRQTGFDDFKEVVDVRAGSPQSLDATLLARDGGNPDALRRLAAAFDVTIEPMSGAEIHRGASIVADVVLMFPRSDVRRDGLTNFRVDVTPAYAGGGTLEFRKGRTVLSKQAFEPATLVTVGGLPSEVLANVKVGDTITWGVFFEDHRKPITAQFEIVSKPQAGRKLAEIDADRRLAKQPRELREQLKAEALQNYRLYSEALERYLDIRTANKESLLPHGGIVACLRRMDLEDTALFTESASKVSTKGKGHADGATDAGGSPALAHSPPSGAAPTPSTPRGLAPAGAVPGSGGASPVPGDGNGTPPVAGHDGGTPPVAGSGKGGSPVAGSDKAAPPVPGSGDGAPPVAGNGDGAPPVPGSGDGAPPVAGNGNPTPPVPAGGGAPPIAGSDKPTPPPAPGSGDGAPPAAGNGNGTPPVPAAGDGAPPVVGNGTPSTPIDPVQAAQEAAALRAAVDAAQRTAATTRDAATQARSDADAAKKAADDAQKTATAHAGDPDAARFALEAAKAREAATAAEANAKRADAAATVAEAAARRAEKAGTPPK